MRAPDRLANGLQKPRRATALRQAQTQLNAQFEAEGLQPFFTRFGVHVGDAVVGTLGSSERMNPTALDSAVKLASRLEAVNKQYGTTTLARGDVYRRVHEYSRFKAIGSVIAKSVTSETVVYELTGALP
jgi:adenylate cyclase